MSVESDEMAETLEGGMRVAISAASSAAERAARGREQRRQQAEMADEQQAKELRARIETERAGARAELQRVHDDRWWERANRREVAAAYQTAAAWRGDPEAERAFTRIDQEVQQRWGVSVQTLESREPVKQDGDKAPRSAPVRDDYDSPERRERMAQHMREEGVPEPTVQERVRADVSQGKPAGEAVTQTLAGGRGAARSGRRRQQQLERTDRGRS